MPRGRPKTSVTNDGDPAVSVKMEDVIYYSPCANYRLGAESLWPEKRDKITARILGQSGVVAFYGHFYRTSNKQVIKYIEATEDYKNGRVRRMTQEEWVNYQAAKNVVDKVTSTERREMEQRT